MLMSLVRTRASETFGWAYRVIFMQHNILNARKNIYLLLFVRENDVGMKSLNHK